MGKELILHENIRLPRAESGKMEDKMETIRIIITVIQVLTALFLVCVVLLQSGKNAGLSGAIAGAADSFLSKNKSGSWDAKLAKATKWVAAVFLILTLVLYLMMSATTAA